MHLVFASIALALAGASALGVGLLQAAVGREWALPVVAGAALLVASRAVRWKAFKAAQERAG